MKGHNCFVQSDIHSDLYMFSYCVQSVVCYVAEYVIHPSFNTPKEA